jgi:hypothetical protein
MRSRDMGEMIILVLVAAVVLLYVVTALLVRGFV